MLSSNLTLVTEYRWEHLECVIVSKVEKSLLTALRQLLIPSGMTQIYLLYDHTRLNTYLCSLDVTRTWFTA